MVALTEVMLPEDSILLFDWGDTLMIDDPAQPGSMCYWPTVSAVDGALEALADLSQYHDIALATGARDSSEQEIWQALARVGLNHYVQQVFCQATLGVGKESEQFFPQILARLGCAAQNAIMVGDSLSRDVLPAISHGMQAVWYQPVSQALVQSHPQQIISIHSLKQLKPHCPPY